ncbi:hypothetical protein [Candidatus Nitrospira inopinata]|jgi:hypothetical protein|uniref:Uncharacterized protein n=1 Tax=Candidatus Nitrospira inopinata TaxID=1715989 RepID=A0A0S4KVB9_9BACT|nr:hypothetical protein [Candidatus Nitrospira inopinata]CUQ67082.1 conserved protein of unknown function [Candidatus Nitrospira inopinata]
MDIEVGSNLYRNSDGTIMIDGVPHIQISRHPSTGALLVNFALFDENGRMLAKVVDSALMFNERRAYNLNKTTRQVSMTEAAAGTVLLHLDMTGPDLVRFSKGTFYTMKGRLLEVSDKEWKIGKQAKSNQTIDANGGPVVIG